MPFSQCEMLAFISEERSPTMRDIATHFKITAPSATSLVEELERGGYITRIRDKSDRRAVRVAITLAGKRTASLIAKKRKEVLGGVISGLSENDKKDLNRILSHIVKDL